MRGKRFLFLSLPLALTLAAPAARACASPGSNPPALWTTHIQSITPQSGAVLRA